MSYFGSFAGSSRGNRGIAPYGSSQYGSNDSSWTGQQSISSMWPVQPQIQQVRYAPPSYEPLLSSRPVNPMASLSRIWQPQDGFGNGASFNRYQPLSGGYRSGRPQRNSNTNLGKSKGSNKSKQRRTQDGGKKNKTNEEYVPEALSNSPAPDNTYVPSRIKPVSSSSAKQKTNKDGPKKGVHGKDRGNKRRGHMRKRANQSTDIPFKSIPSSAPSKSFVVRGENLVCFQGLTSTFATQHEFPIVIDGLIYRSVDHFYQIEKVRQLCNGRVADELLATVFKEDAPEQPATSTDKGSESFGALARKFLKENKVDKPTVEAWRREGGVIATQRAMTAKATQCAEMRELLHSSASKIIVHTYAGDAIFGSGTRVQFVHKWADDLAKSGAKLQIPLTYPLDAESISTSPTVAQGRNLLGLILMQLADKIVKGDLPFEVTMAAIEANRPSTSTAPAVVDLADEDVLMAE